MSATSRPRAVRSGGRLTLPEISADADLRSSQPVPPKKPWGAGRSAPRAAARGRLVRGGKLARQFVDRRQQALPRRPVRLAQVVDQLAGSAQHGASDLAIDRARDPAAAPLGHRLEQLLLVAPEEIARV